MVSSIILILVAAIMLITSFKRVPSIEVVATVWILVTFAEEIIFRGDMMGDIAELIGTSKIALAVNLILSSILFGLAHWYQGRSDALE